MTNRINGRHSLLIAVAMAASTLLSTPTQAGGGISIPLPPLPPIPQIKLKAPPLMVWLPTPAVHVALDSPFPIFAHEDRYYLHSNNSWYVGPGYAGPWTSLHISLLPPVLHGYQNHHWSHYQHEARYWQHHHHRSHPHFYGHHARDHHDRDTPHYRHGPVFPPAHRQHNDRYWHSEKHIPSRDHGDTRKHGARQEHGGGHEHVRLNSQVRDQKVARAHYRGEVHGHGSKHWSTRY